MTRAIWFAAVLLSSCGGARPAPAGEPANVVVFQGMCDASGAVGITDRLFVVADDEDNLLRVYDAVRGGPPLASFDVSAPLGLERKGKKKRAFPELDIEAATRLGDRAYWITSHGRSSSGKPRPERLRFFATTIADPADLDVAGGYDGLLRDLSDDPRLAPFDLGAAAELAPKEPGGLNIEGLTETPDGRLLIGFRNPLPEGRSLLVPLLNAREVAEGAGATRARFGDPILLDLGGRGVRSLSWWRGRFLVIGGAWDERGGSRLYEWAGPGASAVTAPVALDGLNPEGFFTPEERDAVMVLSDDGSRLVDGIECKRLDDPSRKTFRGAWIRLSPAVWPASLGEGLTIRPEPTAAESQ